MENLTGTCQDADNEIAHIPGVTFDEQGNPIWGESVFNPAAGELRASDVNHDEALMKDEKHRKTVLALLEYLGMTEEDYNFLQDDL